MAMALTEISILVAVILTIILYVQRKFSYWKYHHVPYEAPTFPFGNIENPITSRKGFHEVVDKFYHHFKRQNKKHFGIYTLTKPVYVPIDPEIIKAVLTSDFDYFVDHGFYSNEKDDPLSAHLFSLRGEKWKQMRAKLTPTFSSGRMKTMFSTLIECTKGMQDFVKDKEIHGKALDIKDVAELFTIDVIGSCAFGIECNSFKSDSDFQKYSKYAVKPTALGTLKNLFCSSNPKLARALGLGFFPKVVTDFFLNIVDETVKYRKTNNVRRNDLLQILMDLQTDSKMALKFKELAAQAFLFFVAGFETASITMSFCLYELSKHQELQNKVRDEVKAVLAKHDNKITYDAIMDMKYMQQVIDETLRKYPPLANIPRECVQDYRVSNTNATIQKGIMVTIPVFSLHRDPEYFEEPEKFDPERFSPENVHKITPFTYLPFGEGPRMCIGMRFGLMKLKVALATLLQGYKFTVNEKSKIPLEWDSFSFMLTSKSPIWLNVEKIK